MKLIEDVEGEPALVLVLELLVADVAPSDVLIKGVVDVLWVVVPILAVVELPEVEVATNVVEVGVTGVLLLVLKLLVV